MLSVSSTENGECISEFPLINQSKQIHGSDKARLKKVAQLRIIMLSEITLESLVCLVLESYEEVK